jgi:hypothetical protein
MLRLVHQNKREDPRETEGEQEPSGRPTPEPAPPSETEATSQPLASPEREDRGLRAPTPEGMNFAAYLTRMGMIERHHS